ncbi:MAG: phosphotransferase [Planctomycetota bacterium]|jgi:hypothetical protein
MGVDLREVVAAFDIEGEWVGEQTFGNGHLQDTRLITLRTGAGEQAIVLQGINTQIFPRVEELMANLVLTTDHLRAALAAQPPAGRREVLTLIPARDGGTCVHDEAGGWWRAMQLIKNATSCDTATEPGQVLAASRAFGEFLRLLADLDPASLYEVIPRFHDLPDRLRAFKAGVLADVAGRVRDVPEEIAFAWDHADLVKVLPSLGSAAGLPVRATHNDTKVNNALLDDDTGEGVCVLDLDTVMPGLSLYDFGDIVRTMTSLAAEDETDLSKVHVDMALFEAAAEGWLSEAGAVLTRQEIELMPHAGPGMTFMIGLRFLTDHLAGDRYFEVHRPGHNLDRARAQFALLESMEQRAADMEAVVHRIAGV